MNEQPLSNSNSFLGFVPSMVIQHLHNKTKLTNKTKLPEKQSLKSVVMFADISGFTNLTETLSKKGPEGAEIIAFAINRYMELMVKEIGRSGGDIFKFAGDAMIVVWPPPKEEGQLQNTCRQAVQAALSIQSKLDNMNITDGVKLSVKIGFGVGDFSIIYVGGIFGRAEYLPAGDPLTQAFSAEHEAESGGVINCSQQIYNYIKDNFDIITKNEAHQIYQVKKVKEKVMVKADAMMIKDQMKTSDIESIKQGVLQYVPRSLQAYIQYEQEQWSSELRMVTIMFMNIGIDLSDCADYDGLCKIQKVIENIQKCVYMYEGSLNKFLMDDKGSTLIVVFGLPPITHEDDAVRAVLCSFAIKKQLKKENCKCSIGIGTGLVFAGVVGTSGNRREYSVIGDSVNLSARIMQKACYEKDDQFKILCSQATMQQAQHKISFKFKEECLFKGKSIQLPIYCPLDLTTKELSKMDKENKFPSIRSHNFSFPMDAEDRARNMKFFQYMKGYQKELKESEDFVKKFQDNTMPRGCLIIGGDYGVGKSLLLRKLIYTAQGVIDSDLKSKYKYDERPNIIVSNLDPSNKFKKMNIMRSVLKQIIDIIQQRVQDDGQNININQLLSNKRFQSEKLKPKQDDEDFVELDKRISDFKEICGIDEYNYVENFPPPPIIGQKQKEFKEKHREETKKLSLIAMEIFSIYFDQPLSSRKNSANILDYQGTYRNSRQREQKDFVAPLILCLEDLQYADTFSFKVMGNILKNFTRVLIIGCMRTESLEKPNFPHPHLPSQEILNQKALRKINQYLNQYDESCSLNYDSDQNSEYYHFTVLNGLKMNKIKVIIREIYNLDAFQYKESKEARQENGETQQAQNNYQTQRNGQIEENNNNKNNEIKKDESDIQKKITNYENGNLSSLFFSKIKGDLVHYPESLFHNFLCLKTKGNPLLAIHLIENLIKQKLLIIKDVNIKPKHLELDEQISKHFSYDELKPKVGYITGHLKKAIMLEDLITIDVPLCKYNINTPVIDKLACLDLLILKIASVIGDIFDLQTLSKVHPFGNVIKQEKLVEALQNLDQKNFLEVVDQNDTNIFYRFSNSFVRETLYQRLIYTQRRQIHLIVAEAIQNQASLPHNQFDDIEKLKYQWLLGENIKDISITELPHKAKRSIIVKKIQSQLTETNTNTIIKQDYLSKKSDFSKYSWSRRYVVMSTKDIRYYYTNEDSKEKPEEYLGAIPLRFIYEINMLDPKEYRRKDFPFIIKASTWYKKTKQQSKRDFFFSAETKEEYEEWYIYLNIAKTKAQQDEFHKEYGKVNILKGAAEIDITLKNLLESKRSQVTSKVEIQKSRRKTISLQKSPMNKMREKEQIRRDKEKKQQEVNDNETQFLIQAKDQDTLKRNIDQFIKRGMVLFFSHIFQQSVHPEGIESFGSYTTDIYKNIGFPKINNGFSVFSAMRSNTSITSKDNDQSCQKASVDFENINEISNIHNQSQLLNSLLPGIVNSAASSSHVDKDENGNKKRVTINQNDNSANSSPSHKPKIDSSPLKRKSILLKGVSNQVGIVDASNFQTPIHQDPKLLNISPTKHSGSNINFKKLGSLEGIQSQFSREQNQKSVHSNKVSMDQIDQSPKQTLTNINMNNSSSNMINSYEQNSSYNTLTNIDRSRLNSKNQQNLKPPISLNPSQIGGSQTIKYHEQQPIQEENEYFENVNVSPIQRNVQIEINSEQQQTSKKNIGQQLPNSRQENECQDIKQCDNEDFINKQQHKKSENQSLNEPTSPPTLINKTITPYNQQNGTKQLAKNNQINQIDLNRSSTQSSLPQNFNIQSNTSTGYNASSTNNGSNIQQNLFSLFLGDRSNNNSPQSSPRINPFQGIVPYQNVTASQVYGQIYDPSLQQQNQFDDNNMNHQNQFSESLSKYPNSGIQLLNKKQSELSDGVKHIHKASSQLLNSSEYNNIKRGMQTGKKPYQYDHLDKQVTNISISSVGSNFNAEDTYKAEAKQSSGCIKGDLEIVQANKEYVRVAEGNKYGIFKKKNFYFLNNNELNF